MRGEAPGTRRGRPFLPGAAAVLVAAVAALTFAPLAEAAKKKKKKPAPEPTPTAIPRPPDADRVTIRGNDGVLLAATWRPAGDTEATSPAPAVLLLHDFARDRRSWDELVQAFAARGFSTLALDLRGHGESTRKASGTVVKLSPRLLFDPSGFPVDVEAACAWLRQRAGRIGVVGLSLGANLSVLATASRWADTGVAVSANIERLAALAGTRATRPRGLLVLAAEEDAGRAASAKQLMDTGEEPKKTLLYPGAAHNLALFTEHPASLEEALGWLADRLHPRPAAAPAPTPAAPPR